MSAQNTRPRATAASVAGKKDLEARLTQLWTLQEVWTREFLWASACGLKGSPQRAERLQEVTARIRDNAETLAGLVGQTYGGPLHDAVLEGLVGQFNAVKAMISALAGGGGAQALQHEVAKGRLAADRFANRLAGGVRSADGGAIPDFGPPLNAEVILWGRQVAAKVAGRAEDELDAWQDTLDVARQLAYSTSTVLS